MQFTLPVKTKDVQQAKKKKFIKPVVTHIPQQSSDDFLVLAREMFKGSDIDAKMMPVGQTNILMP